MKNKKKILCTILFCSVFYSLFADNTYKQKDVEWPQFITNETKIEQLIEIYKHNQTVTQSNNLLNKTTALSLNQYKLIFYIGNYMLLHQSDHIDLSFIFNELPSISLKDTILRTYLNEVGISHWLDLYFMLSALKQGATFDEARDGLTPTTKFKQRRFNRYDYYKLRWIIIHGDLEIQKLYLEKLDLLFRNYGYINEIYLLHPLIKEHVQSIELQEKLSQLYQKYELFRKGNKAPKIECYDEHGDIVNWNKYQDKIIVIDVWATWCCSCIAKFPDFIKLQQYFKENDDIIFCAISIDNKNCHQKWKNTIYKNGMNKIKNLIAYRDLSSFCKNYLIETIPRYILIDKQNCLVDAFATDSYDELIDIIDYELKLKK